MAKKKGKSPKTWNFRKLLLTHWKRNILIIAVILLGFLGYRIFTKQPSGITTYKVVRTSLIEDFTANGNIKAKKKADLKFLSPGKIAWVGVQAGDKVRAGQRVASLDTIPLNAAYKQALNNLRNAKANADLVLDNVQGHETDENFTQRAERTSAEVARDNAYEAVLAARDNLANSTLISPIDGEVLNINGLFSGINLSGSDLQNMYIRIVDMNTLYFEARLDEVDYSKVSLDQKVRVDVDAYQNKVCGGRVTFISRDGQETSGGVVTLPVEVTFDNCNLSFALGLNGQAHFITSQIDDVLVVPIKYLVKKDGKNYLWKQNGTSVKDRELKEVEVGNSTSTDIEIKNGVVSGDTIIFIP